MPLSHVCYSTRAIFPSPSNACQQEVLRLSAQGKTHWDIAKALDLSPFTVRIHVSSPLHSLKLSLHAAPAVKYSGELQAFSLLGRVKARRSCTHACTTGRQPVLTQLKPGGFQLRVLVKGMQRQITTEPRLLAATEGHRDIQRIDGIDRNSPGIQGASHTVGAVEVITPYRRRQPIDAVIGALYCLCFRIKGTDGCGLRQYGSSRPTRPTPRAWPPMPAP
ncbi:hypothetical protein QF016_005267 [Pseudomonas marginalis]|nr:hypothetical protein [Pseudomonas marginalis]